MMGGERRGEKIRYESKEEKRKKNHFKGSSNRVGIMKNLKWIRLDIDKKIVLQLYLFM